MKKKVERKYDVDRARSMLLSMFADIQRTTFTLIDLLVFTSRPRLAKWEHPPTEASLFRMRHSLREVSQRADRIAEILRPHVKRVFQDATWGPHCDFCDKDVAQVKWLFAKNAQGEAHICNECVLLARDVLAGKALKNPLSVLQR